MISQRKLEKATDLALKNRYNSDLKQICNYLDEMLDITLEVSERNNEPEEQQRNICNDFISLRDFIKEKL